MLMEFQDLKQDYKSLTDSYAFAALELQRFLEVILVHKKERLALMLAQEELKEELLNAMQSRRKWRKSRVKIATLING